MGQEQSPLRAPSTTSGPGTRVLSPPPWSPAWQGCAQSTHTTSHQRWSAQEGNCGCRDDAWPWTWLQSPQNSDSLAYVKPRDKDRRILASRLSSAVSHTQTKRGKEQHPWLPRAGTPCSPAPARLPALLPQTGRSFHRKLLLRIGTRTGTQFPGQPLRSRHTSNSPDKLPKSSARRGVRRARSPGSLGQLQPTESQTGGDWKGPLEIFWPKPHAPAGSPRAGCPGWCPGRSGVSPQQWAASCPGSQTEAVTERPTGSKEGSGGSAAPASPTQQCHLGGTMTCSGHSARG